MTQVAKKQENTAVALASMFKADAGLGTENMHGSEDLGLPFLKVLSQLSPELESVEGAKAGMIYNNVTNKVYDGSKGILCYPVHYERRHIEWQLSFALPFERFRQLVGYMDESFLITGSWDKVRKRIAKSSR